MAEEKKTKEQLRTEAEELCVKYNEAVFDTETSGKVIYDIAEKLEQTVNEYTATVRNECFNRILDTEDPMLTAIRELTFETIKVVDESVGEDKTDKTKVRKIVTVNKPIDLLRLHTYRAGKGIGKDPNWNGYLEQLNRYMTARAAKRILKSKEHLTDVLKQINSSYKMSEIAKSIELGKDPTSNTQILKTLQTVVNAMIGEEFKATSHDVNFMTDLYMGKGRTALSAVCANHNHFRRYIMGICHSIVTGEDYELVFKTMGEKKN